MSRSCVSRIIHSFLGVIGADEYFLSRQDLLGEPGPIPVVDGDVLIGNTADAGLTLPAQALGGVVGVVQDLLNCATDGRCTLQGEDVHASQIEHVTF